MIERSSVIFETQVTVIGAGVIGCSIAYSLAHRGVAVTVSHSGITLAPVHGKVISDLILDGKTDIPIEKYQPDRYSNAKTFS